MLKKLTSALVAMLFVLAVGSCEGDIKTGNKPNPPTPDSDTTFKAVVPTPREWDGERRADISYQLLVYSFADSNADAMGDMKGAEAKLDYLESLGVTAVWLSPIHPADSYHGYDVTDYTKLNPDYGSEADFDAFVVAAHQRGIKVYLDYVLNHTGKGHAWFKDAISSVESPYRDYYIFSQNPEADINAGRLPMFSDRGYDGGEWKNAPVTSGSDKVRYRFTLDWSNVTSPMLTVTKSDAVADVDNPDLSTTGDKYLYFGDPALCKKFYDKGNNRYELTVDYKSPWGFLVRTSNTSWDGGTKWGATNSASRVSLGTPFGLSNSNPTDILFADMVLWQFHSNFYTEWMPDINYGELASFRDSEPYKQVLAAAKGWVDRGVDGLRLDAVKHIYHNQTSDENPTFLRGFYDDMNEHFHQNRTDDIYMVGEVLSGASQVAPYYKGLPAYFEFDFWYRLEWAINNAQGRHFLKDILSYRQMYAGYRADYIAATKLSNHDEDRTRSKLQRDASRSKLAGAVLLTASGSPYIYYGEEIGLYGTKEKDDQYIRSRMLWGDSYTTNYTNGSNVDATMESAVGSVVTQTDDKSSLLAMYRNFTRLRNTYPALATGEMVRHAIYNENNESYNSIGAWYREASGERLLVIHNFSGTVVELPIDEAVKCVVGAQGSVLTSKKQDKMLLKMGAYSSVIFEL